MASPLKTHVVIFPFMAQGHFLPLLDLSKVLSNRGIKVTFITTPSNAKSLAQYIANHPHIHVSEIPFPTIKYGLPLGCENTSQLPSMKFYSSFMEATKELKEPFEQILQSMAKSNNLPICVISDFVLYWTLEACQAFGIPRLVFHGMGALSMVVCKKVWENVASFMSILQSDGDDDDQPLELSGMNFPYTLTRADVPPILELARDDNLLQVMAAAGKAEIYSWGVVVNSFVEIEGNYISSFESFYGNGVKAWCLGPLFLHGLNNNATDANNSVDQKQSSSLLESWLSEQADTPGSVIYASFGTQADVSDAQLDEVALGLEESGLSFILVVRSSSWSLPIGMEDRLKGKGLIIRDWVNQKGILNHCSIGGFLSHCGWNSVLEGLSAGVPILAWPMMADQYLNAKFVVEALGAGIGVKMKPGFRDGGRKAIRESICELMGGEGGRKARERAGALGQMARRAVEEGGSSHENLSKLISQLCA